MNFHLRYDKSITPQKSKSSETSPSIKRIRFVSPSPIKRTQIKSEGPSTQSKGLNAQSNVVDNAVLLFFLLLS